MDECLALGSLKIHGILAANWPAAGAGSVLVVRYTQPTAGLLETAGGLTWLGESSVGLGLALRSGRKGAHPSLKGNGVRRKRSLLFTARVPPGPSSVGL